MLTRLPAPHRAPGDVVRDFLVARFRRPFLRLSDRAYRDFVLRLPDHGVSGGAEIVTCDRRAVPVYERYGVRVHLV